MSVETEVLDIQKKLVKMSSPDGTVSSTQRLCVCTHLKCEFLRTIYRPNVRILWLKFVIKYVQQFCFDKHLIVGMKLARNWLRAECI